MAQVSVNITSEDLQKSARKYRKELLQMPVLGLSRSLQHMTLRPGIRYAETVGELSGDMQLGPYSETREDNSEVVINPRTLYTYFGSVCNLQIFLCLFLEKLNMPQNTPVTKAS